ncbi:MAG: hypothetical protein AAGC55_10285, partial [Myxococcota bacterium]
LHTDSIAISEVFPESLTVYLGELAAIDERVAVTHDLSDALAASEVAGRYNGFVERLAADDVLRPAITNSELAAAQATVAASDMAEVMVTATEAGANSVATAVRIDGHELLAADEAQSVSAVMKPLEEANVSLAMTGHVQVPMSSIVAVGDKVVRSADGAEALSTDDGLAMDAKFSAQDEAGVSDDSSVSVESAAVIAAESPDPETQSS